VPTEYVAVRSESEVLPALAREAQAAAMVIAMRAADVGVGDNPW
jgi:hypothetical protein